MSSCRSAASILTIALATVIVCPPPAWAFDTGHHFELTDAAMREAGFSADAIRMVQVSNWLTDYMNTPVYPDRALAQRFDTLHFDNLPDTRAVERRWGSLVVNTRAAIGKAAAAGDTEAALACLGLSLHAVQDFYSHSNWVDLHPRRPGRGFRTETYGHGGARVLGLFTSGLPSGEFGALTPHGDYFHGMNKDSYVRPGWPEAYVFAYAATREWLTVARGWMQGARAGSWNRALAYHPGNERAQALEATRKAAHRLSAWGSFGYASGLSVVRALVPTGTDGHWKGNGSGSFIATLMSAYANNPSSSYAAERVIAALPRITDGMAENMPVSEVPTWPPLAFNHRVVVVRTEEATELRNTGIGGLDTLGSADFYSRVRIGNQHFEEAAQQDQTRVAPAWTAIAFVPRTWTEVPIHYRLRDQDWPDRDDACDITGDGPLRFTWDLVANRAVGLRGRAEAIASPQGGLTVTSRGADAAVRLRLETLNLND